MPAIYYAQSEKEFRITWSSTELPAHTSFENNCVQWDTFGTLQLPPCEFKSEPYMKGHHWIVYFTKKTEGIWSRTQLNTTGKIMVHHDWEHFDWNDEEDDELWKEFDIDM